MWEGQLCNTKNYYLFDQAEDGSYPHKTEARDLCAECPAFALCEQSGRREPTSIWAGKPKREGLPM